MIHQSTSGYLSRRIEITVKEILETQYSHSAIHKSQDLETT